MSQFEQLKRLGDYDELEALLAQMLGVDLSNPGTELPENPPPEWVALVRGQAEADLYFFGRYVVKAAREYFDEETGEQVIRHPFLYESAVLIQDKIDRVVDIWSRFHWKSMWKTFIWLLWNVTRHPTHCAAIICVTRELAKSCLRQIQEEIETNPMWALLWPEIFPRDAKSEGLKPWSVDEGLKLLSCPARREYSFEAIGLDKKRTGKHFNVQMFDDMHDERNQTTPKQISKALDNFSLMAGLQSKGCTVSFSGTWYGGEDDLLRRIILERDVGTLRFRKCVKQLEDTSHLDERELQQYCLLGGVPVFTSVEHLENIYKDFGAARYAEQMLLDLLRGISSTLDADKFNYYLTSRFAQGNHCNRYILVDPGGHVSARTDRNDPSAILVVGLGPDRNFYILDAVKEKMDAVKRNKLIISLHRRWKPKRVLIEENFSTSDTVHLQEMMESPQVAYRFKVYSVAPRRMVDGGDGKGTHKVARLMSAVKTPLDQGRIYLPERLVQTGPDGRERDRVREIVHEIEKFPLSDEDHYIAAWSLLFEQHAGERSAPKLVWPEAYGDDDYMAEEDWIENLVTAEAAALTAGGNRSWLSQ